MTKTPKQMPNVNPDSLSCPNCGTVIAIGELMSHQVAERVRSEMKSEIVAAQEEVSRREDSLRDATIRNNQVVSDAVTARLLQMRKDVEAEVKEATLAEIEALRSDVQSVEKILAVARGTEIALRTKTADLERKVSDIDVEVARKVDEARAQIGQQVAERVATDHRLALADRDRQLSSLTDTIAILQQKLEQGSQQHQGETAELLIEELLRSSFPLDSVEPVPKGVNGADCVHRVVSRSGLACGSIIFEVKRTKAFNSDWPGKLRADQRVAKSEIAVLISQALPEGVKTFSPIDNVWVCGIDHVVPLVTALRSQLVAVSQAVAMDTGKKDKAAVIYEWISGPHFKQRIEAIVEAFTEMQSDIAEERRVSERRWARREKQVQTVINSTSGMYGDLQAMVGSSLEQIKLLEAR